MQGLGQRRSNVAVAANAMQHLSMDADPFNLYRTHYDAGLGSDVEDA